jgi:pilus assembly protein Flp/PilA
VQLIDQVITGLLARITGALDSEEGQGLVEYGLIIVFVSLACIVALGLIGTNLSTLFNDVAGKVKGP